MTSSTPDSGCVPGSTDEQLPAHILALLTPYPLTYLSTACETARLLAQAHGDLYVRNKANPSGVANLLVQIMQWRMTMHNRCRLNHKFVGRLCICSCHAVEEDSA